MPDTNEKVAALDALAAHTHEAASIWHEAWRTWLRAAALSAPQGDPIPKGTAAARSTSDSAQEPDAPGAPASPAGAEHIPADKCGFDRNSSISEDRYVCECGWRDTKPADLISREQAVKVDELLDRARQYVQRWQDSEGIAYGSYSAALISELLSLVASLSALPAATQGWVMVPLDPTPAMIEALEAYYRKWQDIVSSSDDYVKAQCWSALHAYRAMLSAAQPPAATEGEGK